MQPVSAAMAIVRAPSKIGAEIKVVRRSFIVPHLFFGYAPTNWAMRPNSNSALLAPG